jgi:hypothetical protein
VTKLRLVPYRDLKKVLAAKGFHWLRCGGSHNVFRHDSGPNRGGARPWVPGYCQAVVTQNFERLEFES